MKVVPNDTFKFGGERVNTAAKGRHTMFSDLYRSSKIKTESHLAYNTLIGIMGVALTTGFVKLYEDIYSCPL